MRKTLSALFMMFLLIPSVIYSQEKKASPHFGLTFPNPGVIWHISDNIAFLPNVELIHNWFSSDQDNFANNSFLLNAEMRFYIQHWKGLNFYLAPRYGWGNSDYSQTAAGQPSYSGANHIHTASGAWGVQYALTDRLSLFADIGAKYQRSYQHSKSETAVVSGKVVYNTISTQGTGGLILYLK